MFIRLAIVLCAGVASAAPAHADQPMTLRLETAYAVAVPNDPGHVDVYVVINNRTGREVTLTSVQSSAAGTAQVHKGDEAAFPGPITIPDHAELYMLPGGVHIGLQNAVALAKVLPLELEFDGKARARIAAVVVNTVKDVPDHHSFPH